MKFRIYGLSEAVEADFEAVEANFEALEIGSALRSPLEGYSRRPRPVPIATETLAKTTATV